MTAHSDDEAVAPLDLERLASLSDGGPDEQRELATLFLATLNGQMKQMSSALCAGDLDALMMVAHTAGGAAGMCGASRLAARLLLLEAAARDRQTRELANDLHRVEEEAARVSAFLQSTLAR